MFAVVTKSTFLPQGPGGGAVSVRHLDAEVIGPCPCQLLGYRGVFTLVDRNTGDVTGISLYATEAEARQLVPHGAL